MEVVGLLEHLDIGLAVTVEFIVHSIADEVSTIVLLSLFGVSPFEVV